jgi:hypothetical protein
MQNNFLQRNYFARFSVASLVNEPECAFADTTDLLVVFQGHAGTKRQAAI